MKKLIYAILAVLLVWTQPRAAFAEHYDGDAKWNVTFTQNEVMKDNFSDKTWADNISKLQPGDDITFNVRLKHDHSTACDWYMANEVLKTLEEQDRNNDATGSAYTYKLTYYSPSGKSRVLYENGVVGGDESEGLKESTDALKDYLYLDTLSKGQEGRMEVQVALDGETEGNAYFETIAQLKMKFAVELPTNSKKPGGSRTQTPDNRTIVRTGDETRLFPLYVAMVVSGVLLAALVVDNARLYLKDREEIKR